MDEQDCIFGLTALAQPTRMAAFRHLVKVYPDGIPAGEVARLCEVPHNTMSSHLAVLARAGLVSATKESRTVTYCAGIEQFRALIGFLTQDCCSGRADICAPLLAELECCPTSAKRKSERNSKRKSKREKVDG